MSSYIRLPASGASATQVEIINSEGSPGVLSGNGLTDNLDGTIAVAESRIAIRATDDDTDDLLLYTISAVSSLALTDNDVNYIYVEYNSGSPQVVATVTERTDYNTNVYLGSVYREGTDLHINGEAGAYVSSGIRRAVWRLSETQPFQRASGAAIGESGTRNVTISAGVFWEGLDRFTTAAFDSSVSDTWIYVYRDGLGGWTEVASQTQIDNTQYDDGSGTLATLSANAYGVHWVYLENDGDVYILYGQDNYNNLGQAEDADPPSTLPDHMVDHARLLGKIIIRNGEAAFAGIQSAFDVDFAAAPVVDHGSLSGLNDGDHDAVYLRLDTANDPVTGDLDITGSLTVDDVDINLSTISVTSANDLTLTSSGTGVVKVSNNLTVEGTSFRLAGGAGVGSLLVSGTASPTGTTTFTAGGNLRLNMGGSHLIQMGVNNLIRVTADDYFEIKTDTGKLRLGAGPDIDMYWDGTGFKIDGVPAGTIAATDKVYFEDVDDSDYVKTATAQSIADLYTTTGDGLYLRLDGTNDPITGNVSLNDTIKLLFGTGDDASINYDGTNLVVDPKEVGTGVMQVLGEVESKDATEASLKATYDDSNDNYARLYRDANGSYVSSEVNVLSGTSSALEFDGGSDRHVIVTDNDMLAYGVGFFTASCWVKTTDVSSTTRCIMSAYTGAGFFLQYRGSDDFWSGGWVGSGGQFFTGNYAINDGAWHHIAVQRTGTDSVELWVDGVSRITKTGIGSTNMIQSTDFKIGVLTGISGREWNGSIEEVAFWGRQLADTEIADLYNSGSGFRISAAATFASTGTSMGSNLTCLYHLDENGGTTAADSSGNGYDGTLVNSPTWGTGYIPSSGASEFKFVTITDSVAGGQTGLVTFGNNASKTTIDGGNTLFAVGGTTQFELDSAGDLVSQVDNNIKLQSDASKIYLGASDDTSLSWDGTNTLMETPSEFIIFNNTTLGSEEVTNGSIATTTSWSFGSPWTHVTVDATVPTTPYARCAANATNADLSQTIFTSSGKLYQVSFKIVNPQGSSWDVTFSFAGYTSRTLTQADGAGTYTFTFLSSSGGGVNNFKFTGNTDGSSFFGIDDVSLKEVQSGNLHVAGNSYLRGACYTNVTTVTTTSHTAANEHVILVDDDTAGAAVTVTLPAASGNSGLQYVIKKIGSTANVVIDGNGSETIDGATTATLTTQYEVMTVICNGTAWFIGA